MDGQAEQFAVMPDLTAPQHGFHHTVDSALASLARLGVGPERVTIRKVGRGWAARRVVEQHPDAGKRLASNVLVELGVEGDGLFEYLPLGMREASKEDEVGTEELVSLFDDPVEKAAHFVRQGGLYFDVRPENLRGCARWIRLFGLDADEWPRGCWYRLAVLLPRLRDLAGREDGLRLALRLLLNLEIEGKPRWRSRRTLLAEAEQSRLSARASQLGVDLILGDGVDDEVALEIKLGPVSLERYDWLQTDEGRRLLDQVMTLVAPYHWAYEICWLVGDAGRAPRLGIATENAALGVNSHLGWL